ncbi:MAG TPA: nucleoside triphosphate pyrophosphohydrolase [Verrucomicrobiae bacterium]|nr:nucleoside triphosphate pyrophosphohydrolase [Verrucomicrobiae bacterium]
MATQTKNIARLLRIMARLRGPKGCPWDREQTHRSIRHNLIEECYEALDAMDADNMAEFRDELGDLLLQVVFHAQMASETGEFNFDSIAKSIADKLVRRHPHVFGRKRVDTSIEVLKQWEAIKKKEKNSHSIVAEIPRSLPALLKADKVQRKVARVGFDWRRVDDVVAKVEEELRELKGALASGDRRQFEEELGDLLFAAVNLARFEGLHAEELLNRTISKFVARFQQIERAVHKSGRRLEDCTLEELDALWESAKHRNTRRRKTVPRPREQVDSRRR